MKFETFDMREGKRILVTDRKLEKTESPVVVVNDHNYPLLRISYPSVAACVTPDPNTAYLLEPKEKPDSDASWDYFGFLDKICRLDRLVLGIIRPGFLESLTCSEVNKLRGFIHYENSQDMKF